MSSRRRYTQEFKREAVEMTKAAGVTARQVARELGIHPNALSRWGRELQGAGEKAFQGPGKARDEETAALKRELARVKKERDFLKETAAYFAKESR
jgi:transposase